MNLLKKTWIYLLICTSAFYILPMTSEYWGSGMMDDEIILLFLIFPFVCLITSGIYGVKNGFSLMFPILVGLLFLSTIFVFYNSTALIYVAVYSVISIIGCGLGRLFYKCEK